MGRASQLRGIACAAAAATGLLVSGCDVDYDDPPSGGPATAFVWIAPSDTVVDRTAIQLQGDTECDDCPRPTAWVPPPCPPISCPTSTRIEISWTNRANGATARAAQVIAPVCHCSMFLYGYCYSACKHGWWATVPLAFGANQIEVAATRPGYVTGTETRSVERVPQPPAWIGAEAGPGEITLSWVPVEGATSYNLYWSTTPYSYASLCEKIEDVSSPYTHSGLANGETHYYYVRALNGGSESFDSRRLEATPQ
jgi:hypothetical protein